MVTGNYSAVYTSRVPPGTPAVEVAMVSAAVVLPIPEEREECTRGARRTPRGRTWRENAARLDLYTASEESVGTGSYLFGESRAREPHAVTQIRDVERMNAAERPG